MVSLLSPDVEVTLTDQSFNIPGSETNIPLIIIATQDEKINTDGSQALGTFESGVIRTVTSISQSEQLYGIPKFLVDANGNAQYGDVRNEYGLDALNKVLEITSVAYVLRANVNLDDTYANILTLWNNKISDAGDNLNALVTQYIKEYNSSNGLVPADSSYKATVSQSELTTLVGDALAPVLSSYSFSSSNFSNNFLQDHTVDHAGFQDVIYTSTSGYIQTTDATGLENDTTQYGFTLNLVSINGSGTFNIQVAGEDCQTFGTLISELQTAIQTASSSNTTVTLLQGRIRVTSDLLGATSSVTITSDGFGGVSALFSNTNLFSKFDTPTSGEGIQSLSMYDTTFTIITDSYDGVYSLINNWNSGSIVTSQFTAQEAEGLLLAAGTDFSKTKEFLNNSALGANDAARRTAVVKQLKAIISDPNTGIRAENIEYDIAICPGFPEVAPELITLSQSLHEEVFIIGETPFDKPPTGPNSIAEWATTTSRSTSADIAYYYPHGQGTNLDGSTILTTAGSIALRVYAFSDQQADVWYAPAGVQRGTVQDIDNIGYISGTLGTATTFVKDNIDKGDRDVLYQDPNQINPIAFIPGRGILVMGQKTTYGANSALNRVNASRLVKLIKRALRKGLFPFLFEPNDEITRNEVQAATNSFLGTLVTRRALYDFASICDLSNNTPDIIDANELIIDIALKVVKTVEWEIVNLHLVTTGANIGGRTTPAP